MVTIGQSDHINYGRHIDPTTKCMDRTSKQILMTIIFMRNINFVTSTASISVVTGPNFIRFSALAFFCVQLQYGYSFIAACYVKLIESAGGRAAPVLLNQSPEYYKKMFNSLNGFLIPGGGQNLTESPYQYITSTFLDMSVEAYKKNIIFPIWGICLGFEMLNVWAAKTVDVLEPCDAEDLAVPLDLKQPNTYKTSRLFKNISAKMLNIYETKNVTVNYHQNCVTPSNFEKYEVNKIFTKLSINKDTNGTTFISTVEGINAPIYGTQWHPEKNIFIFTQVESHKHTPHDKDAILAGQYIANFFVNQDINQYLGPTIQLVEELRELRAMVTILEEREALIYNYDPAFFIQSVLNYVGTTGKVSYTELEVTKRMARIKKIMQTDEEVGKVAAAVPIVVLYRYRSHQLFGQLEEAMMSGFLVNKYEALVNRNSYASIKQCILSEAKFDFLRDLVESIPDRPDAMSEDDPVNYDPKILSTDKPKKKRCPKNQASENAGPSNSADSESEEDDDDEDEEEEGEGEGEEEEEDEDEENTNSSEEQDINDVKELNNSHSMVIDETAQLSDHIPDQNLATASGELPSSQYNPTTGLILPQGQEFRASESWASKFQLKIYPAVVISETSMERLDIFSGISPGIKKGQELDYTPVSHQLL
ncbi:Gamma-glutamyl hydrolase [Nymphon striatum]|nr:Gamma-glutamyl hydrolase [Nymphon striatum]